jgi:LppP/LprE lipoprotein
MRVVTQGRAAWLLAAAICLSSSVGASSWQVPAASWLDRPLIGWNSAGSAVPKPPGAEEEKAAVIARCRLKPHADTLPERALDTAGWIVFWNFDQQLVRDGVEVVGGMSGADGMCRPANYNLFVFVDGRFAGTLSPTAMTSRLDGSSGAVRLPVPQLTAEFARYSPQDPLCCPSSRVTVRYRIDRLPAGPVVVPVDVRTTRGQTPENPKNQTTRTLKTHA